MNDIYHSNQAFFYTFAGLSTIISWSWCCDQWDFCSLICICMMNYKSHFNTVCQNLLFSTGKWNTPQFHPLFVSTFSGCTDWKTSINGIHAVREPLFNFSVPNNLGNETVYPTLSCVYYLILFFTDHFYTSVFINSHIFFNRFRRKSWFMTRHPLSWTFGW